MRLVHIVASVLLLLGGGAAELTSAHAAETNTWRVPGTHPLSPMETLGRDKFSLDCAAKLSAPKGAYARFAAKIASGYVGPTKQLTDGMLFIDMTYGGCHIWPNVQVEFGPNAPPDWRNAEVVSVLADDGSTVTYYRPFKCNNWAILSIVPPRKTACYVIPFNHTHTQGVIKETADEFEAKTKGNWPSAAQAYLNQDLAYTFVLFHIDATDAELADLKQDQECFGIRDATGFHQGVIPYCLQFCVGGHYPNAVFIRQYNALTSERLPEHEPNGSFQFACPEGKCELVLPLRYAARDILPCVAVERYHVSLAGRYRRDLGEFRFDFVTAAEGAHSLELGKKFSGDIYLRYLNDDFGHVRTLTGASSFVVEK